MNEAFLVKTRNEELENPAVTNINRLSPRSNLIPAQKGGIYYKNKEESEFLQSLCGDYRFCYCKSDCMEDFFLPDFDDSQFDVIDVPSMWQYRGYGSCSYPNTNYPIPFDPPYIRCENPVGYYRRSFIAHPKEKTILHFGGVDNAFYVYLNGQFVGFSKGSRIPAEFDVSDVIREGENLLAVKVFTYSDATYLENQDMLMANGIFRDVYLLHTDRISLWDFRVTTDLKGFRLQLELTDAAPAYSVEILIATDSRVFPAEKVIDTYFAIENPRLWNSEEPNLYDLEIRILKNGVIQEIHSKKIGMLHSCIDGNHVLVNGQPIYIKGINRHEYDCRNGKAISVDLIEKELKLIKANNINAIRCSHYTNHPAFYELCSELGIFVMDEADIETHGCDVTGDQGYLTKKPEWLPAYLDRVDRMLRQNKNEACIFMYSMNNEAGKGENLLICQKHALAYEPNKIAIHDQEQKLEELTDQPNGEYDFLKRTGYLSAADLKRVIQGQPVCMQIEYGHAMGNSPGYLAEYQRFVYENENYAGGFVWEFKNHGFYQKDENGNEFYMYGGDFGDKNHWANFCLDGYLMSDGTPKHSWYELGEAFSPVYVTFDGERITLKNTFNFRNLDTLELKWELLEDYTVIKCGSRTLPSVRPHDSTVLDLDITPPRRLPGAAYYLNLSFYDGERLAGMHQLRLMETEPKLPYSPAAFKGELTHQKDCVTVSGKDFEITLKNGILCRYIYQGRLLLDQPFDFNLYRAPTDNDGILTIPSHWFHRNAYNWNEALLDTMHFAPSEISGEVSADMAVCRCKGKVLPLARYYGLDVELEYRIYQDGLLAVQIKAEPYGRFPEKLPRIGLCFPIEKAFDQVMWYGRGPRESYSDCKEASPIGLYTKPVEEMYTIFDKPQETGNHENTSFVILQTAAEKELAVIGCDEFAFSCHDFSQQELTKARHRNELKKSEQYHYLYLDYKMRGLGSNSCGPEPEPEYELTPHAFQFSFVLAGGVSSEQALELARTDFGIKSGKLG